MQLLNIKNLSNKSSNKEVDLLICVDTGLSLFPTTNSINCRRDEDKLLDDLHHKDIFKSLFMIYY